MVGQAKKSINGVLYMLMGSTSMAFMNIGAKLLKLHSSVSVLQLGFFRGLIMAVGCYLHTRVSNIDPLLVPKDKAKGVFSRAFFGYLSYMFQFWCIFLLPFSLAIVLYFT